MDTDENQGIPPMPPWLAMLCDKIGELFEPNEGLGAISFRRRFNGEESKWEVHIAPSPWHVPWEIDHVQAVTSSIDLGEVAKLFDEIPSMKWDPIEGIGLRGKYANQEVLIGIHNVTPDDLVENEPPVMGTLETDPPS